MEKAHLAACRMIPTHRNFADAQSRALREMKQLDVEGKAIDPSGFQNWTADIETERFETTLRIPKRETDGKANEQIKNAAGLLAPPGLMLTNQSPI